MAEFLEAYNRTNKNEGGYVNDPDDNGGETYAGITKRSFPNWQGWALVDHYKPLKRGQVIKDVTLKGMVKAFYKQQFWDKIKGDLISDQAYANDLYDSAVNFGIKEAIRQAQVALGFEVRSGKVDDETLAAINNPDEHLLA